MKRFVVVFACLFCIACADVEKKPYKYNRFDIIVTCVGERVGQITYRLRQGGHNVYSVRFLANKEETLTSGADIFIESSLYEEEIKGLKSVEE